MQWDDEEQDLHFGIAKSHGMHRFCSFRTSPFAQAAHFDQELQWAQFGIAVEHGMHFPF